MQIKINALFAILKREINIITHDKDLLVIILLSPIFYALFYGTVYINKTENNVPLTVVDKDHSAISRSLVRSLDAHQLAEVVNNSTDLPLAREQLERWQVQGILYIPAGFQNDLKSGRASDLKVFVNTSRFLPANDLNKAIAEVTGTLGAGVQLKYYQAKGLNYDQAIEVVEPLHAEIKPLFNPAESYGDFLIPGLLILIIQQTLLIGLAESMAREREQGSLAELHHLSRGSIWAVISGKSGFYFMVYAAYSLLFANLHYHLFKIPLTGSTSALFVLTLLLLASVVYISLFIASFFKRKIIALQFFVFVSYPIFLLSGYSWPVAAMPAPLQALAQILPSTPYLQALSRITLMGAGWGNVVPDMIHLATLTLIGLILTRLRMKYMLNEELNAGHTSPFSGLLGKLERIKK